MLIYISETFAFNLIFNYIHFGIVFCGIRFKLLSFIYIFVVSVLCSFLTSNFLFISLSELSSVVFSFLIFIYIPVGIFFRRHLLLTTNIHLY